MGIRLQVPQRILNEKDRPFFFCPCLVLTLPYLYLLDKTGN